MKYFPLFLVIFILSICTWSCSSSSTQKDDCYYGLPTAIFSDTLENVDEHEFKQNGQVAFEEIRFENGMQVEIQQSGCDSIRQVFQLKLPGGLHKEVPVYFKKIAIGLFRYFGTLSDKHAMFNQLSNLMTDNIEEITLGKKSELTPGMYIRIDRVLGEQNSILLVELSSVGN